VFKASEVHHDRLLRGKVAVAILWHPLPFGLVFVALIAEKVYLVGILKYGLAVIRSL
jgi:hypothetical protein